MCCQGSRRSFRATAVHFARHPAFMPRLLRQSGSTECAGYFLLLFALPPPRFPPIPIVGCLLSRVALTFESEENKGKKQKGAPPPSLSRRAQLRLCVEQPTRTNPAVLSLYSISPYDTQSPPKQPPFPLQMSISPTRRLLSELGGGNMIQTKHEEMQN
eukprot:TRINITY_DN1263_c5_g1_i1.p1 TRINITY_DN1263_c5_g1~~TRINITY_DN1263_c5_g1_i1.p1  ORF type:complete len:158 (+),score=8.12 TRINITY_DN1263_c5_g1_i1:459-932(+)